MDGEVVKMECDWKAELERLAVIHETKCDEYKKLILLNAKFRLLLAENGVDHDL